MEFDNEWVWNDWDQSKPDDERSKDHDMEVENDLNGEDMQPDLFRSSNKRTVQEGNPSGGQSFGKNNTTPAGNDKNNPSRYAGTTNPYFNRTEPMEEHPEFSNFKSSDQEGWPDYDKAQPYSKMTKEPPAKKADSDYTNAARPNEVTHPQKTGEKVDDDEREHIET